MSAERIVDRLLENEPIVRVCANCQKEHGIAPQANESHGICRRHAIDYWADVYGREAAEQKIAGKPESDFTPELPR